MSSTYQGLWLFQTWKRRDKISSLLTQIARKVCVFNKTWIQKSAISFHPHCIMYLHHNLTVVESLFNKRLEYNQSIPSIWYKGRQKKKKKKIHSNLSVISISRFPPSPFISTQLVNKVKDQEQITISDINKCILRLLPYTMYKFWHAKLKDITAVFQPLSKVEKNKKQKNKKQTIPISDFCRLESTVKINVFFSFSFFSKNEANQQNVYG